MAGIGWIHILVALWNTPDGYNVIIDHFPLENRLKFTTNLNIRSKPNAIQAPYRPKPRGKQSSQVRKGLISAILIKEVTAI